MTVYTYLMTVKCSLITGQTKLSKSQSNYFYAMVEAYNRTNDVIFSMLVPLYLKISFVKCCRTKWQKCTVMSFFTQHLASLEWFKTHDLMICFSPQQQAVIVICDLEAWFFNSIYYFLFPLYLLFPALKTMCTRGLLYVSANVCRATFCSFTGYLACISCTFHSMGVFVQSYVCLNVCVNAVTGGW